MFTAMTDAYPTTDAKAIEDFEASQQFVLPSDYKKFLLQHNGGRPREDRLQFGDQSIDVQVFYGLLQSQKSYDIAYAYGFYLARGMPRHVVPVACASIECSFYCLDLERGGVSFWDQSHHWGTGEWREEDFYPLTDTFDEFLALLVEG